MTQLKLRDQTAFEQLYGLTSGRLYASILRLQLDRELAADLLQESFVKIWREADKYRSVHGEVWAWMSRVARNAASIIFATARGAPKVELPDSVLFSLEASQGAQEHSGDLQCCLREILPARRGAIVLSYVWL